VRGPEARGGGQGQGVKGMQGARQRGVAAAAGCDQHSSAAVPRRFALDNVSASQPDRPCAHDLLLSLQAAQPLPVCLRHLPPTDCRLTEAPLTQPSPWRLTQGVR
jgi:hypothetical protein